MLMLATCSAACTCTTRWSTHTLDGKLMPALCYIATTMESHPASNEYIDRIIKPARDYLFPAW
jgi:hypothetical protein